MRYWHPFVQEAAEDVAAWQPDDIFLLPLYPQFSTTTTETGFDAWDKEAARLGLDQPSRRVVSYEDNPGWVAAQVDLLQAALAGAGDNIRILFSAHGLPKRTVDRGDPYPDQVETGARAIMAAMGNDAPDWQICYQSRVGPLEWIGPSLDDALQQAAADGVGVVVVPISFVSEHSETLVELDMEYRDIAAELGVSPYVRVPAVGVHPSFIGGLVDLVREAN